MAWNEPGGGNQGGKDPWGNKDDQGPPDLDEAFRKLQNNLSEMFGGKKSTGGGGGGSVGKGFSVGMLGVIAVVFLLGWAAMGVYQIDRDYIGIHP
jgi:membrane protease subunit HflK